MFVTNEEPDSHRALTELKEIMMEKLVHEPKWTHPTDDVTTNTPTAIGYFFVRRIYRKGYLKKYSRSRLITLKNQLDSA